MNNQKQLSFISIALLSAALTGCGGDAETIIIERDPIVATPTDPGTDTGGNTGGDFIIDSAGRLAIMSAQSGSVSLLDLDDSTLLDEFPLSAESAALYASPDNRYAVVSMRSMDMVEFIDGGLWREDHIDHLHDYEQAPQMSDFMLNGSRPTHIDSYDGQMAIFYDGDSEAGIPAAVQVITDADITSENNTVPTLDYTINMHGVAKPRGEVLVTTIRRDDSESTSNTKILPDQVGIYHWHDGEYELEQVLENTCPDLHGSAINEDYVAFGCGDGVLVAHQHGEEFESVKIDNIDALEGLRIGTLYGHKESALFFGIASSRATGELQLLSINPASNTMEQVEWQPEADARPISYGFSYAGDKFVILDNQGYVSKYEIHEHDGELEFEFDGRLDISEADITTMPEGHNFSMTMAQNGDHLFVADPIAEHILHIDLDTLSVMGDMELNIVPSRIVWLGIADGEHGHDH